MRNETVLRRAHAIVLLVIVLAASPFVWRAVRSDGQVPPSVVERGRAVSAALAQQPLVAAEERERFSSLDQDLPPPPVTLGLTQRAVSGATLAYREGGFLGWFASAQQCYDALTPTDLEQRVYCLQLDAAAYAMEREMPEAFQAADAHHNPFFTREAFIERQLRFAPPNGPSLSPDARQDRKTDVLMALATVLDAAMNKPQPQDDGVSEDRAGNPK